MYPGLGTFPGLFGWSSSGQYDGERKKADEQYGPIFKKFQSQDVMTVAANSEAKEMGQRLFLTYCSQCHGSDAKGAIGFPNLTDNDWLFGGTPEQIKESIQKGRDAMMPAKGVKPDLNGDQIKDIAGYVRSLSGLATDSIRAQRGKELFAAACSACHGPDGKGMVGVAPNLADKVWLYGSSEDFHHRNHHQGPRQSDAGLRRVPRRCEGASADGLCLRAWRRCERSSCRGTGCSAG